MPRAPALIQASDGNFYGTTYFGGGLQPRNRVQDDARRGAVTIIHPFATAARTAPTLARRSSRRRDGNLYGTTEKGGAATGARSSG